MELELDNQTCCENISEAFYPASPGSEAASVTVQKGFIVCGDLLVASVLLVYAITWKRQNLHGKIMGALSFAMLLYFVSLTVAMFETFPVNSGGCVVNAIIFHFGQLSTYFWVAVLNFDMWSSLSSMVAVTQRNKGNRRLAYFSVGAFGIPLLAAIVAITLDFSQEVLDTESSILPQYGSLYCVLRLDSYLYYGMGPVLLAFVLSAVFGNLTVNALDRFKREVARAHEGVMSKVARNECLLVLKLYVLMGTIWGLEPYSVLRLKNSSYYTLGTAILTMIISVTFACLTVVALVRFKRETNRLKNVRPEYITHIEGICVAILLLFLLTGSICSVEIILIAIYGDEMVRWFGAVMTVYHFVVALLFFRMFMVKRQIVEQLSASVPILKKFTDWVEVKIGYVPKSRLYSSTTGDGKSIPMETSSTASSTTSNVSTRP